MQVHDATQTNITELPDCRRSSAARGNKNGKSGTNAGVAADSMYLNPKSTVSYWLKNAPFQKPYTGELPSKADIVIIGAGLTGMSTAYWLRQLRPDLSIIVMDARGVASGATGRNGGILAPGLNENFDATVAAYGAESAQRLVEFDYRNVEMLTQFLERHADRGGGVFDPELTWTKGTIVAWSSAEEAAEELPAAEKLCSRLPEAARLLTPDELVEMTGITSLRFGGMLIKKTAIAWAAKVVFCLAGAIQDEVVLATHTRVERVVSLPGACEVHTNRGTVIASKVAYCTNAWTQRLLEPLQSIIVPVRNQVVSAKSTIRQPWMDYVISANRGYQYMSCRPNGDVIMGGMRDIVPNKQEHEDDDSSLNMTVSQALREFVRDTLKVPDIEREWVGVMGFTRDRLPLVGDLRYVLGPMQGKNQYIAAGFTGHGMSRTFLCGRALAQLLTDQSLEDWFPPEFLVQHPSRLSWWQHKKESRI